MMKKWSFVLLVLSAFYGYAQVENDTIDLKYLDDQFYMSMSYNVLISDSDIESSTLFSGELSLGFLRDIPFNKRRNVGIALGLGYSFNTYNKNIFFEYTGNNYSSISRNLIGEYETSKFRLHSVELPIEFRWRTSTPTKYKFWRIYPGFRMSYLFYSKAKIKTLEETVKVKNLKYFNEFQYGVSLTAGYGTWNLFMYYGLSPIFNAPNADGSKLDLSDFLIGLKFYML